MTSDFALSLKRPEMISYFQSNVSSGMDTVSFHNANAALVGTSNSDSSLLSASSFSLAATTSSNKAGFCAGLLSSLTNELDFLSKNAVMDAQRASLNLACQQNNILKDPTGNILKGILENKDASQKELEKYQETIQDQIGTLEKFTSNADVRFKGLKESAEQQEFMAKNHYYLHNSKNLNQYGTYSSSHGSSNNNSNSTNSSENTKNSTGLNFKGIA